MSVPVTHAQDLSCTEPHIFHILFLGKPFFLDGSDRKLVERAETTEDEVHDDNIEVEDVESDNTVEDKETGNADSDSEEGIKRTTLEVKHDTETEEENKLSIGSNRVKQINLFGRDIFNEGTQWLRNSFPNVVFCTWCFTPAATLNTQT